MKSSLYTFERMMREIESHPKELAEIVGKKDSPDRLRFLAELRLWQESDRPSHAEWLAMSASGDLEKDVQGILRRGQEMVLSYFGLIDEGAVLFPSANVL
jgi:hypothetical protein